MLLPLGDKLKGFAGLRNQIIKAEQNIVADVCQEKLERVQCMPPKEYTKMIPEGSFGTMKVPVYESFWVINDTSRL